MNTKRNTTLTFFIFKAKKRRSFIGACIELGIVQEGDSIAEVKNDLEEAAKGYVETVRKEKLSDTLLNQTLPKELMSAFEDYLEDMTAVRKKKSLHKPSLTAAEISTRTVADLCYV